MNLTENSKTSETKQKQVKSLPRFKNGSLAIVVDIRGDDEVVEKLETMGIRPNVTIKKVSSSLFRGPIVLEIDFMQIAIGYDIASKILCKDIGKV